MNTEAEQKYQAFAESNMCAHISNRIYLQNCTIITMVVTEDFIDN